MEELLRILEQPRYFLPLFVAWWLVICALLAYLSGWADLAKRYRAEDRTPLVWRVIPFRIRLDRARLA
jgi:hypothetical protein